MSTNSKASSVLIEVKNLNKFMGQKKNQQHILKDISFSIEQGEFISIIGQSGSGKSTLMHLLGCLDTATSGEFSFRGKRIDLLSPDELADLRLKSFGFVFQKYNLLNSVSALENVALPAIYSSLNASARRMRAMKLLSDLGLEDKYDSKPNELSGGQQQRVSIARALMNGGEVILADEPTGALDSKSGEIVLQILEKLHQAGHTIILVTHDSNIAKRANRVIEIKDGEILSDRKNKDTVSVLGGEEFAVETKFSLVSQIFEASKMSIHSIWSNRLRSFLTMLGIIIGICSVTIIIAIGRGANQKFLSDWKGLKEVTLMIYPGRSELEASSSRLNIDDVTALKVLPEVMHISPNINVSGKLIYLNKNLKVTAQGSDDFGLKISNLSLVQGRFISKDDVKENAKVIVIDEQTAKKLFVQNKAALNKTVLFNKQLYEVVGIAKNNYGSSSPSMWVPDTALQAQMSRSSPLNGMTVVVKQNFEPEKVQEKVRKTLIARHQIEDFQIFSSDEAAKSLKKYIDTITYFISAVAFISLLVGGIGVMNIMLVSVTERIKEIGLRMAIGAKKRDISMQFLIEASVLCLVGGLIGGSIAFISSLLFNAFSLQYKMIFSWSVALFALLFSSIIGLVFGYIPANRASNLKPIEALTDD
ncbi:ATP-binding cassette domain-containing protein [Acinetobacter sp. WCHAc010034]|uniref:ABC transporter permease n=1 Tax=Acinetobacter sp. WCHAc010034 TaxID=1879049 RepID=UPI000A396AED|nr:ABC transporter permease [Acinetobacter sp. WCHAc010034]AYA02723.1 ATP-binding cassette domain-containing protein [Acinetobacter sp. WCHAc010034]